MKEWLWASEGLAGEKDKVTFQGVWQRKVSWGSGFVRRGTSESRELNHSWAQVASFDYLQGLGTEDLQEDAEGFDEYGGLRWRTICEWESGECVLSDKNHVNEYTWSQSRQSLLILPTVLMQAFLEGL